MVSPGGAGRGAATGGRDAVPPPHARGGKEHGGDMASSGPNGILVVLGIVVIFVLLIAVLVGIVVGTIVSFRRRGRGGS